MKERGRWGNRILLEEAGKDLPQVVLVPAGAKALVVDPRLGRLLLFQEVDRNVAQDGEVLGAVILPDAALIFAKRDVQQEVRPVGVSEVFLDREGILLHNWRVAGGQWF